MVNIKCLPIEVLYLTYHYLLANDEMQNEDTLKSIYIILQTIN